MGLLVFLAVLLVSLKFDREVFPWFGVLSTTAIGDLVWRGCKRKRQDVIDWNSYDKDKKRLIMRGICEISSV